MKRNNTNRESRGISLFSRIRLGPITGDEFTHCLTEPNTFHPDYFRWFCGQAEQAEPAPYCWRAG